MREKKRETKYEIKARRFRKQLDMSVKNNGLYR